MNEEYEKFNNILNQILYKINQNESIQDIEDFIKLKQIELENYHNKLQNKEEEYLNKLVSELK